MVEERGDTVFAIRAVDVDDVDSLVALFRGLSDRARHMRFLSGWLPERDHVAAWAAPQPGSHGIVAVDVDTGVVIGEARWTGAKDGVAEIVITVGEDSQGMGIGRALLGALGDAAVARHVQTLTATVAVANRSMRRLLGWWGYAVVDRDGVDVVKVALATDGGMPGWLPDNSGRPRVLVEGGGWAGRADVIALTEAGFRTAQCLGPSEWDGRLCPLIVGRGCPLAEDANVIVFAASANQRRAIRGRHALCHPEVPVLVCDRADPTAAVREIIHDQPDAEATK